MHIQSPQVTAKQLQETTVNTSSSDNGDPFDPNAAPIMYMSDNRTAAKIDMRLAMISTIFITCILLLLLLVPSIRRNKWRNFVCLTLVLGLGASIPTAIIKTTWMVGDLELRSVPYDSLQRTQFSGTIQVQIGLESMNVSLVGRVVSWPSDHVDVDKDQQTKLVHYNERFQFERPDGMEQEHQEALQRGLPYPILSVTEFFSQDSDGFNWTRQIRQAGQRTKMLLYLTLASWLVTLLLMCALPAYFMTLLRATCLLTAGAHLNYLLSATILSPSTINIYGFKLLISPNYTILVTSVCSIAAYCCAQYIDSTLDQEHKHGHQSITIMDSESYLKDKRALTSTINASGYEKSCIIQSLYGDEHKNTPSQTGSNPVVIPIGDIEAKFGPS